MFWLTLVIATVLWSCNKVTPEEKAKEFVDKQAEAIKNLDFNELQKIQEEETKYLESCTEDEKASYSKAVEKYYKTIFGDDFCIDADDIDEDNSNHSSESLNDSL